MAFGDTQTTYDAVPLRLRNAYKLSQLVNSNTGNLAEDFPGVCDRYSNPWSALKSIKRAQNNPELKAFALRKTVVTDFSGDPIPVPTISPEETPPNPFRVSKKLIGLATLQLAEVIVASTGETLRGVCVAGWLDQYSLHQGAGTAIAEQLYPQASQWARLNGSEVFTYIRPENEAAVLFAEQQGLRAQGVQVDYADQAGDNVTAPRLVFATHV